MYSHADARVLMTYCQVKKCAKQYLQFLYLKTKFTGAYLDTCKYTLF